MPELGHRFGIPQLLVTLAAAAILVHLYGLYRPTGPPTSLRFPYADKVQHLLGFAVPVCLVLTARWRWQLRSGGVLTRRFTLLVVAVFALHAVVSELAQHFFYLHRTGDYVDALADWVGVALGWAMALLARHGWHLRATRAAVPARAA